MREQNTLLARDFYNESPNEVRFLPTSAQIQVSKQSRSKQSIEIKYLYTRIRGKFNTLSVLSLLLHIRYIYIYIYGYWISNKDKRLFGKHVCPNSTLTIPESLLR